MFSKKNVVDKYMKYKLFKQTEKFWSETAV